MNSSTNKYFNYQRTNTDPNINKKIKIKAKLLKKITKNKIKKIIKKKNKNIKKIIKNKN